MINEFIEFSSQNYNRENRCEHCPNDCPETGDCEKCLEMVHFGIGERVYNCGNILKYYVCKYTYKYASEIGHVFKLSIFNDFEKYNVLSLGCGPCTDYFGIQNASIGKDGGVRFNYLGIDINENWRPVHNWLNQRVIDDYAVKYMDVFDFLKNPSKYLGNYTPNVIIINYLISDLLKAGCDVYEFIRLLEKNLFRSLDCDSCIIINDYNRGLNKNDPRYYYDSFSYSIGRRNDVERFRFHFKHDISEYYKYGDQHKSNRILFSKEQTRYNAFNPWLFCSSAQLIIKKK